MELIEFKQNYLSGQTESHSFQGNYITSVLEKIRAEDRGHRT